MNKFMQCIEDKICEDEIVRIISKLVNIPSHRDTPKQEADLANWINNYFAQKGIESELIHVLNDRSNVVARIPGTGQGNSLLLTGHMDTVPPFDMPDPFNLKIENNRMYGRGVVDMKSALACMMYTMALLKEQNVPLLGDLVFAGVVGEETDCQGTMDLLKSDLSVNAAIVGEPSNLNICVGHRGLEWLEFTFKGKTVHGGNQEEGVNAIQKAIDFINKLNQDLVPKIEKRTHSLIGQSSANIAVINGGTQPSTVPNECVVQIDRRWVPSEKYDAVIKEYQDILCKMQEDHPGFSCTMRSMTETKNVKHSYVCEAMETIPSEDIVKIAVEAVTCATGHIPALTSFPAWTDGGLLSTYGQIPTIIFGPGDIKSAHSPKEHLNINHIRPATLSYLLIATTFCM